MHDTRCVFIVLFLKFFFNYHNTPSSISQLILTEIDRYETQTISFGGSEAKHPLCCTPTGKKKHQCDSKCFENEATVSIKIVVLGQEQYLCWVYVPK